MSASGGGRPSGSEAPAEGAAGPRSADLRHLAGLFLRLGATAFGGPAAHIAMMEDEVVRRRGWLGRDEFLDLVGATNLIPGPNSTELAIHIGYRRAGWPGLLVAGACFILPAAAIVWALAWVYSAYGHLPAMEGVLYGVKPVVIAVVVQALWRLGTSALKNRGLAVAGIAAAVLNLAGVHELYLIFGMGLAVAAARRVAAPGGTGAALVLLPPPWLALALGSAQPFQLSTLFLVFVKIGAVLFGSGYVLLAFLRSELVVRLGWLTEAQLLDAVAVGQVTPGPVFTTATFVGYLVGGHAGAAAATAGIFLPAFVFVAASGPLVPRLRRSATAGAFLDGVNVGSLALMAVVTWQLGRSALVDPLTVALAALGAVLLLRFRLNSSWLVLAGACLGWLARPSP
jgi:chromate transporter